MSYWFVVVFTTSTDKDFSMKSSIPLDVTNDSFTWESPFKINGISSDCILAFDFYLETKYKHRVKLTNIEIPTGRLTYMKTTKKLNGSKKRRNSMLKPTVKQTIESNNITVDRIY